MPWPIVLTTVPSELQSKTDRAAARTHLQVVAGILQDASGRILIAERLGDPALSGLWEFPGGKLKSHESPAIALARELHEELGVTILSGDQVEFMRLQHSYPDRTVAIEFFRVLNWQGEPVGREGQALRWAFAAEIAEAEMLAADAPVLLALRMAGVSQAD